jgi:hypothetical protein
MEEVGRMDRKISCPFGDSNLGPQASSLVTIPTTLLQVLPVGRTEELRKAQGSNLVKPTENTPRGDLV